MTDPFRILFAGKDRYTVCRADGRLLLRTNSAVLAWLTRFLSKGSVAYDGARALCPKRRPAGWAEYGHPPGPALPPELVGRLYRAQVGEMKSPRFARSGDVAEFLLASGFTSGSQEWNDAFSGRPIEVAGRQIAFVPKLS